LSGIQQEAATLVAGQKPPAKAANSWCGRGDSNPAAILILRKLFIPRSDTTDRNSRNAEVRYTAGTRSAEVRRAEVCHEAN
jgi:hypothetical protein